MRSELEHKTKYANALEETLKNQENVIDQTQGQEKQMMMTTEMTVKQNDEDTFEVCMFVYMHMYILNCLCVTITI